LKISPLLPGKKGNSKFVVKEKTVHPVLDQGRVFYVVATVEKSKKQRWGKFIKCLKIFDSEFSMRDQIVLEIHKREQDELPNLLKPSFISYESSIFFFQWRETQFVFCKYNLETNKYEEPSCTIKTIEPETDCQLLFGARC